MDPRVEPAGEVSVDCTGPGGNPLGHGAVTAILARLSHLFRLFYQVRDQAPRLCKAPRLYGNLFLCVPIPGSYAIPFATCLIRARPPLSEEPPCRERVVALLIK
jgi:hypothetical protein